MTIKNRQNKSGYELLHHDYFNVLTNIDLIALIPTRKHTSV